MLEKDGADQLDHSCEKLRSNILHRVKEEGKILHTVKRRGNWNGHILRRNCLLKGVFEGKIGGRI
jgi:hypothetical protein